MIIDILGNTSQWFIYGTLLEDDNMNMFKNFILELRLLFLLKKHVSSPPPLV